MMMMKGRILSEDEKKVYTVFAFWGVDVPLSEERLWEASELSGVRKFDTYVAVVKLIHLGLFKVELEKDTIWLTAKMSVPFAMDIEESFEYVLRKSHGFFLRICGETRMINLDKD